MNKHIGIAAWSVATAAVVVPPASGAAEAGTRNCTSVLVAPASQVLLGKSSLIPLAAPVTRIVAGGQPPGASGSHPGPQAAPVPPPQAPGAATEQDGIADIDVLLLSPTDLFLRGKKAGGTNLILQDANGVCYLRDVVVSIDPATVQAKLAELMPDERGIKVSSAENAIVLTGAVSDASKLDEVVRLASTYGDAKRLVNLLRVPAPQQVMLEVKIAEVSKTLLDKFGINAARMFITGNGMANIVSGIFGGSQALFGQFKPITDPRVPIAYSAAAAAFGGANAAGQINVNGNPASLVGIDAQKKDGLVRVLAEPNIVTISGQSASFLSGGKIFIPVAQTRDSGGSTITLEEKEFGVGLKFSPTVLDGSRINLKLVSEVSELAQTGSPFTTTGGVTSVLPSISTRRVDTTVQLNDGQSFAVAGLIRNNVTETISRFPGLGSLPILGALFRSTEFQKDQTELIFVITPRLVKPATNFTLPTDNHMEPSVASVLVMGKAESGAAPTKATAAK